MTLTPLVERELRTALRRPGTYRLRWIVATSAIFLATWGMWVTSGWIAGASAGHALFNILAGMGYVGCLSAGIFLIADTVSKERREGTLGLLFLTDLKPIDIVLGKLAAKAVVPFYAVLALQPALATFVIMGGISPGELFRTMVVLVNTLFVSLAVALLTSTFCTEQRAAHFGALLVTATVAGGGAVLASFLFRASGNSLGSLLMSINLTTAFYLIDAKRFSAAPGMFTASLVGTHLIGWGALMGAGWFMVRAWKVLDRPARSKKAAHGGQGRGVDGSRNDGIRAKLLSENPLTWLGSRSPWQRSSVWLLPIGALMLSMLLHVLATGRLRLTGLLVLFGAVQLAARLWIALDSSHAFGVDRRNGTLESLLGTPLTQAEIARGMAMALWRRFAAPVFVLVPLTVAVAAELFIAGDRTGAGFLLALGLMLPSDALCLNWIGLWRGLATSGATEAILSTIARTILLPLGLFAAGFGAFHSSPLEQFPVLFGLISVVNNLAWRVSARTRLLEHFRTLALRPFGAKPPHIESAWSPINWDAALDDKARNAPA